MLNVGNNIHMIKSIDVIKRTRNSLLELVHQLDPQQLNQIPDGFANNIIWNMGHMISAQQGLCYFKGGLKPFMNEEFILAFQPGSRPHLPLASAEIDVIKSLFVTTMEQLENDIEANVFRTYHPWRHRLNIEMTNIHDVLCYLPYHEGLHADRIAIYKRLIN
jgi:hypothetical protein